MQARRLLTAGAYRCWATALTLVAGACLVTACGGAAAPKSLTVHGTDFTYTQGIPQTLKAGKAHFVFVNDSKTYPHEMWIYPQQQPKLQDMLNQKQSGNDVDEYQFLQNVAGKADNIDPGKAQAFDVQLASGTYELACLITSNIGGKLNVHYNLGMHTTITVQ